MCAARAYYLGEPRKAREIYLNFPGEKGKARGKARGALLANATRAVLGTVRRSAVLNTRHSVRSVPGRSVVVYEVARGFSGGQEFATSINVANEDSVTGVTELGVQPASLALVNCKAVT